MAAALAAAVMLSGAPCGMQRAEAGWDGWDDVIEVVSGTLIASFQRTQLLALGDNPAVQAELCSQAEKENDGRPDRRAVILTDSVMTRLVEQGNYALKNNSLPFRWRVVHKKEFNAYCDYSDFICVYDKLVKACHYNEDELAAVLAHEMAHGYNQHVARDAQKTILADVLADVALDQLDVSSYGVGRQLPQALVDFAIVKNTTVASEKRADESGFYTMASAGFNPGGAAAMMARMMYFTEHSSQVEDFFFPNDHPDTRVRRDRMAELMTAYGIGHPTVGQSQETLGDVYFDNQFLLRAEPEDGLDEEEMSYLIAGGIAKGFHDHETFEDWAFAKGADGTVGFAGDAAAYAPLRRALAASGKGAAFQAFVEQAYLDDARTGARDKWLKDEREHEADVEKERAKQAAAAEASPKKAANGDMYLELGLTNFAEKEYTRAKALDEENPDASCGLAMVEGRRGHHAQALAMVDDVLAKHAGNAHALVARADIHRHAGDLDAALADCEAALAADAGTVAARRIIGELYDQKGDCEKALEAYRAYHEAAPEACDIPADYMTMLVDGIAQDGEGR